MHFKIVKINPNWMDKETRDLYPDVLLYVEKDDPNTVIITASGYIQGSVGTSKSYEDVTFSEQQAAEDFIRDFSVLSAIEFCYRTDIIAQPEEFYALDDDEKE